MKPEIITRTQLTEDLGLLDKNGNIWNRAVADLLRAPLSRWGLSPKRAILKYARDQLRAAGIDDVSCVQSAFQRLVTLGECVEVYVGHEPFVVPAESRWVQVGYNLGAFLGVSDPPEGISYAEMGSHSDIVRWILVSSDEEAALLQVAGVREISIDEWISPAHYLHHAARRMRGPARSDTITLATFWDMLEEELVKGGLLLNSDAEVRVLTGEPGQFFGRENATDPEGRWTANAPDGVWCALRRGYGEAHWHPAIIAVSGEERRVLDLYDRDEWRWALLARGKKLGFDEVVSIKSENLQLTYPPPAQLRAALDLVGSRTAPWGWKLNAGAPDVLALIL